MGFLASQPASQLQHHSTKYHSYFHILYSSYSCLIVATVLYSVISLALCMAKLQFLASFCTGFRNYCTVVYSSQLPLVSVV